MVVYYDQYGPHALEVKNQGIITFKLLLCCLACLVQWMKLETLEIECSTCRYNIMSHLKCKVSPFMHERIDTSDLFKVCEIT